MAIVKSLEFPSVTGILQDPVVKTADFVSAVNYAYLVTPNGSSPLIITPPLAPVPGDLVRLIDPDRSWRPDSAVVFDLVTAGQLLRGVSANYQATISGTTVDFVYMNATIGWLAKESNSFLTPTGVKTPVRFATSKEIPTLHTYNGPLSVDHQIGATLTSTDPTFPDLYVDSGLPQVGDLVLVRSFSDPFSFRNGVYVLTQDSSSNTQPWVLTRHPEWDSREKFRQGSTIFVKEGNLFASKEFCLTLPALMEESSDSIQYSQIDSSDTSSSRRIVDTLPSTVGLPLEVGMPVVYDGSAVLTGSVANPKYQAIKNLDTFQSDGISFYNPTDGYTSVVIDPDTDATELDVDSRLISSSRPFGEPLYPFEVTANGFGVGGTYRLDPTGSFQTLAPSTAQTRIGDYPGLRHTVDGVNVLVRPANHVVRHTSITTSNVAATGTAAGISYSNSSSLSIIAADVINLAPLVVTSSSWTSVLPITSAGLYAGYVVGAGMPTGMTQGTYELEMSNGDPNLIQFRDTSTGLLLDVTDAGTSFVIYPSVYRNSVPGHGLSNGELFYLNWGPGSSFPNFFAPTPVNASKYIANVISPSILEFQNSLGQPIYYDSRSNHSGNYVVVRDLPSNYYVWETPIPHGYIQNQSLKMGFDLGQSPYGSYIKEDETYYVDVLSSTRFSLRTNSASGITQIPYKGVQLTNFYTGDEDLEVITPNYHCQMGENTAIFPQSGFTIDILGSRYFTKAVSSNRFRIRKSFNSPQNLPYRTVNAFAEISFAGVLDPNVPLTDYGLSNGVGIDIYNNGAIQVSGLPISAASLVTAAAGLPSGATTVQLAYAPEESPGRYYIRSQPFNTATSHGYTDSGGIGSLMFGNELGAVGYGYFQGAMESIQAACGSGVTFTRRYDVNMSAYSFRLTKPSLATFRTDNQKILLCLGLPTQTPAPGLMYDLRVGTLTFPALESKFSSGGFKDFSGGPIVVREIVVNGNRFLQYKASALFNHNNGLVFVFNSRYFWGMDRYTSSAALFSSYRYCTPTDTAIDGIITGEYDGKFEITMAGFTTGVNLVRDYRELTNSSVPGGNNIFLGDGHGWTQGDEVLYRHLGGGSTGSVIDKSSYFVDSVTASTVQLISSAGSPQNFAGTTGKFALAYYGKPYQLQSGDLVYVSGSSNGSVSGIPSGNAIAKHFKPASGQHQVFSRTGTSTDDSLVIDPTVKTTSFNASSNTRYFVDTNTIAFTVSPPSSPALNDTFELIDIGNNLSANNVTVNTTGSLFHGAAVNASLSNNRATYKFIYLGVTSGWTVIGQSQVAVPPSTLRASVIVRGLAGSLSLPATSFTPVVNFNAATVDTTNSFNVGTGTFTAPRTSLYLVAAGGGMASPPANNLYGLNISVNGTTYASVIHASASVGSSGVTHSLTSLVSLSAGDFLRLNLYNGSASSTSANTGVTGMYLTITEVNPSF